MTNYVVLIFIDMLVCCIAFSAAEKQICAFYTRVVQSTVLALTLTQSSIFADVNKNMLAQNGNSDL